jgi:hypothetical protein
MVARGFVGVLALAVACAPVQRVLVHPPRSGVDLNRASRSQLAELPGVDTDDAARIVANRPYDAPDALVLRGIVSPEQFDEFSNRVYVSRLDTTRVPGPGDRGD